MRPGQVLVESLRRATRLQRSRRAAQQQGRGLEILARNQAGENTSRGETDLKGGMNIHAFMQSLKQSEPTTSVDRASF